MSDYLLRDPSHDRHPASTPHVKFQSGEVILHGVLHLPAGKGPHPIVVLLHGFPGWERNFDVAQALRRAGVAALVFHYRGCWGMGGKWSWAHTMEDTATVLDGLASGALASEHVLDVEHVAVAGHSLGGFLALATARERPWIRVVASVSGFNFGAVDRVVRLDPSLRNQYVDAFQGGCETLTGADGETLMREMEKAGSRWNLENMVSDFAHRSVLLVGTSNDDVTPASLHHDPLVDAFETHRGVHLSHARFHTDHALSDHRVAMTRQVVDFITTNISL